MGNPQRPALPDLVYIVRPGEENDELRFSLRSVAANMKGYRKVWIVGTVPSWLRNVEALPLTPHHEKFTNQRRSLAAVCAREDAADVLIVLNDDHFVTEPVDAGDLPTFHLGDAETYLQSRIDAGMSARNTWMRAIKATLTWAAAHGGEALAYEAHVPLAFERNTLAAMLADYPQDQPFALGEVYPLAGAGPRGDRVGNVKVTALDDSEFAEKLALDMPYLSTNDRSFAEGAVGAYLRGMFPNPGPYEEA